MTFRIFNAYEFKNKQGENVLCVEALVKDKPSKFPKKIFTSAQEVEGMLGRPLDRGAFALGLSGLTLQVEENFNITE